MLATATPSAADAVIREVGAPSFAAISATAPTDASGGNSGDDGSGHEGDTGLRLVALPDGNDPPGSTCAAGAFIRDEHVVAMAVDITVNRYGDHDPQGRMFAFEDQVARVRDEEARNAEARTTDREPAVTAGLQGDAIQPLVLRVHPGECLRITLRNDLAAGEAASITVHGAGVQLADGSGAATITNPKSYAAPGATVTYEWQVPKDEPEGTHYFHSAGDERTQVDHGLFGALIVEPPGSTWLDPRTQQPAHGGWDAVITRPNASSFREFTLIYHEIGNETYQLLDRAGGFIPLVDDLTDAYRPASRALNYRSEPFRDRLLLGQATAGHVDESLAYSSYAYGDPATPIMRSYLGEPAKQRILHGGPEVAHVHHLHGGAVRWARQPGEEADRIDVGLDKHPPLVPDASETTDSQTIEPSESYDVANACASGGCQQTVGDLLYHCHIAQHYFAGMWGFWRVYNTLQNGPASTDTLPPFAALPDRPDDVTAAVSASVLRGTTVDSYGHTTAIDDSNFNSWIEQQLPPAGVPKAYDASVWDWQRDGSRILGEPETSASWPGYRARAPGARPEVTFDPRTGKVAYPMMRPHLAARPPFAPDHNPAPFLDPVPNGADLPAPGADGPGSLCPSGTKQKQFDINAIPQAVPLNAQQDLVDPNGMLYVLRQQEDAARKDPALQVPLALRANAGEDCVDILLRSELDDNATRPFSKVSLHIHYVQFDAQGSDGLDAGFNYEQTVRPFRGDGVTITAGTAPGDSSVTVTDASPFSVGAVTGIGLDQENTFEARRIVAIDGNTLRFDRPLASAHGAGEVVSNEFVRYRWYVDSQFGTAYFHDHVDAIHGWSHGLFGALIAEPPGSTYTDPHTGQPLVSGAVADIHTTQRVSTDVTGSFRELALFIQDDNKINAVGRSTGSAYSLRAEPLDGRTGPTDQVFSSHAHGDPATALLEANLGDPVVVRNLVGSTNDVHTVHIDGHWFRAEPWSDRSPPINTIRVGISERYDVVIPAAGGPQHMPGDYLYYSGRPFKLHEGSWGLFRVHAAGDGGLQPLPGHEQVPAAATDLCPSGAPHRPFAVTALDVPLPMLNGQNGKVYVSDSDADAVLAGTRPPEPLVLHANVGDCIDVTLTNKTTDSPVTYHCDLLAANPATSGGVAAGNDSPLSVAPGAKATFTYYASPEVGPTVSMIRDFGDVLTNPGLGLYGAIVIGEKGTTYRGEGWQVDAFPPNGAPYRDATLLFEDDDESLGTHRMPYAPLPRGTVGINYQAAPIEPRLGTPSDPAAVYRTDRAGDPPTPIIRAFAGDRLKIHVLAPWSEQVQSFGLEGHDWATEPGREGTNIVGSTAVGGLEAITIEPRGGAGGLTATPGDYLYGDGRLAYREAGEWGLLRVYPTNTRVSGLTVLARSRSTAWPIVAGFVVLALWGGGLVGWRRRRRRRRRTVST